MSQKHLNSIHVSHYKHTAGCATEVMPVPDVVKISMSQHIGAPSVPCVSVGDTVKAGDLIANVGAGLSVPQYASITGSVTFVDENKIIIEA